MTWAHDYLREVIGDRKAVAGGYHWERMLAAVRALESERTTESEAVLRAILEFQGDVPLHPDSSVPHAMAPEHLLQSTAMHILAEWDRERHQDVIRHVANTSRSADLARIARAHLAP